MFLMYGMLDSYEKAQRNLHKAEKYSDLSEKEMGRGKRHVPPKPHLSPVSSSSSDKSVGNQISTPPKFPSTPPSPKRYHFKANKHSRGSPSDSSQKDTLSRTSSVMSFTTPIQKPKRDVSCDDGPNGM